ncbi:hypothetical protein SLE2022_204560 [Rubroshorea leprosula]
MHLASSLMELNRAELALAVIIAYVAITREAHRHGTFTGERDETETVTDELVVFHRPDFDLRESQLRYFLHFQGFSLWGTEDGDWDERGL